MNPGGRPFRFGVLSPAATGEAWLRDARDAEARGYSTLVLTDHLDLSGAHVTRLSWLPAMAAACFVLAGDVERIIAELLERRARWGLS